MLQLEFDGMCEPVNPGGIVVGSYLLRAIPGQSIIEDGAKEICRNTRESTNNTGEFSGLILGLEALLSMDWPECLVIQGDSKIVIDFIAGPMKIKPNKKAPHLEPLKMKIKGLLEGKNFRAVHVPREKNKDADRIGREEFVKQPVFNGSLLWLGHWWFSPATQPQLDLLRRNNVTFDENITGREASVMIARLIR